MQSLNQVWSEATDVPSFFDFACQLQKSSQRLTKSQKPFYEVVLVDSQQSISLKIWENHAQFQEASHLKVGDFLHIQGNFSRSQYGLESSNWQWARLSDEGKETLLLGDPNLKAKQEKDLAHIKEALEAIQDPRLYAVCQLFMQTFYDRFLRAAGARKNHHARRGGLVEHVAQMMRSAQAICQAYTHLNLDLLVAAILFHDAGKLWENNYPPEDFHQLYSLHAEALGHISLGIELVNKLWKDCLAAQGDNNWMHLNPPTEHVRIHLMHLIASHHGTLEYGSPVVPKTPEAYALHFIDNLDAKLEMFQNVYTQGSKLHEQIYERQFPFSTNLIKPLHTYEYGSNS